MSVSSNLIKKMDLAQRSRKQVKSMSASGRMIRRTDKVC